MDGRYLDSTMKNILIIKANQYIYVKICSKNTKKRQ